MSARSRGRDVLLPFSIAVIAIATLIPGSGSNSWSLCLLCRPRDLADLLANILLFAPLGFALHRRGWRLAHVVLAGAVASVGIELAQLDLIPGRDSNIGDVLANTLGARVGAAVFRVRWIWFSATGSLWRTVGFASAISTLLLMGLSMFVPAVPDSDSFVVELAPNRPDMASYPAEVHSVRIGDVAFDTTAATQRPVRATRWLFGSEIEISAVLAVPRRTAPMFIVTDERERNLLMLAANRADLVYRQRLRADAALLDRSDIRVHQAFELVPPDGLHSLLWQADRRGYCLELDERITCGRGFTVGDTWSLLLAPDWGTDERAVMRASWMFVLFLIAGLPAVRYRNIVAGGVCATGALVAGPLLMSFAATPAYQLIVVWLGLLTGRWYGTRRRDAEMQKNPDRYP